MENGNKEEKLAQNSRNERRKVRAVANWPFDAFNKTSSKPGAKGVAAQSSLATSTED